MPSVTELTLEAVDIVDSIDLGSIGITSLTDKDKSLSSLEVMPNRRVPVITNY